LQGIFRETAFVANELQVPLPIDLYIPPGGTIRIYDSAAIAAGADDMTVAFQYMKFTV
jgi:predicted Zn-dependent protease